MYRQRKRRSGWRVIDCEILKLGQIILGCPGLFAGDPAAICVSASGRKRPRDSSLDAPTNPSLLQLRPVYLILPGIICIPLICKSWHIHLERIARVLEHASELHYAELFGCFWAEGRNLRQGGINLSLP